LWYFCWINVGFSFNNRLYFVDMSKKNNWEDISFILRGKHRKRILRLLITPKTPTQLKNETKLHFNSVSRTLIELEKKGFLKCLNPKQKLVRFYLITDKGKNILNQKILEDNNY